MPDISINSLYHFELRLVHLTGYYSGVIDTYSELEYLLVVNEVGVLNLTLPGNFPKYKLTPDMRIEVWLSIEGGPLHLEGDTQFLIQAVTTEVNGEGEKSYKVVAFSLNHILKRRVIAYTSENVGFGYQIDQADDMMKVIVRQNFGSLATTARDISAYLSVDSDLSLAASIEMDVSYKYVLDVLKDIANASLEIGTPLFFEIVAQNPPSGLAFRVFVNNRGQDRRFSGGNALILSQENGSIGAYTVVEDYDTEVNYVYAFGPGEGDLQMASELSDTLRVSATPFSLKEAIYNNQQTDSINSLDSEGRAFLVAHRPRRIFEGAVANAPGAMYGRHWFYGDRITVQTDDDQFDCFLSAVHVVSNGTQTTIDAVLRNDT
jgi:hypothetical protein